MPSDLQQKIIEEFGSGVTQEAYIKNAEKGLWGAEKILIEKYFKSGSSILDIGCGTGRTTIPLYQMGYKIVGVDITPEMIYSARKIAEAKSLEIAYEIGDATRLTYGDSSFDNAIFSNNGWTQIPGEEKRLGALKEIYRILKPNGYFIFTTHTRTFRGGFLWLWVWQWIKLYILKPLGFKIEELDFGDRFFARESGGTKFKQKQFIHIPDVNKVKKQIAEAGFELIFMEREDKIETEDLHDKDNVYNWTPMFYVCKK
ncbi:MAG: class I SAM-dependent methyltransferase [Candidatus Portnoybacteria bacterium]|nr:class I SAM-dependent methyltransferase [Candidatus Portnoybacteria bacterium]